MKNNIFLFDIDGVLIKPGGYKQAMQDTCKYILSQGGIEQFSPVADVYACFESQRITSEWDMVPLYLLIVVNEIACTQPIPGGIVSIQEFSEWVKSVPLKKFEVPYLEAIRSFGKYIKPGKTAAQCVYEARILGKGSDLFKNILNNELIYSFLENTRDYLSPLVRKFQEYALGGDLYKKIYKRAPDEWSESYLLKYDEPIISEENSRRLLKLREKDHLFLALYTARPSLAPKGMEDNDGIYSPEAELAAKQCGLAVLPLIGYGKLGYLASKTGKEIAEYIKPSPGQALAAIYAAWTGDEWDSLCWADRIIEKHSPNTNLIPMEFDLYVFEDSAAGIQGARAAVEILQSNGWIIEYHPIGISDHPEKVRSLENAGATIYQNVNLALIELYK